MCSLFYSCAFSNNIATNYWETIDYKGSIEKTFSVPSSYQVNSIEYPSNESIFSKYKIWYPTAMEKDNNTYPVVVMANGTGVPDTSYETIFEHLASWGFIVIGNNDGSSWDGISTVKSLNYILNLNNNTDSIFLNKVNKDRIGVAGHSQGGVGVINAITIYPESTSFTSAYTASCTSQELAADLKWPYDVKNISIPYFMCASTGKFDSETIAPESSLETNYNNIKTALKIRARRTGIDHGQMLAYADAYMTAWFMYTLKNDQLAQNAFSGSSPEISSNSNWTDVAIYN
jgi:Predicted dienelactone hydrolase